MNVGYWHLIYSILITLSKADQRGEETARGGKEEREREKETGEGEREGKEEER